MQLCLSLGILPVVEAGSTSHSKQNRLNYGSGTEGLSCVLMQALTLVRIFSCPASEPGTGATAAHAELHLAPGLGSAVSSLEHALFYRAHVEILLHKAPAQRPRCFAPHILTPGQVVVMTLPSLRKLQHSFTPPTQGIQGGLPSSRLPVWYN